MANGQIKVLLPFVVAVAVVVVVWPMNDWTVKWVERCVVDPNLSCQVQVKSLLINGRRSLSVCHMHTRGHFLTILNHHGLQYAASTTDSGSVLDVRFCCQFGRNVFATNYRRIPQFRVFFFFFCFLLLSSIIMGIAGKLSLWDVVVSVMWFDSFSWSLHDVQEDVPASQPQILSPSIPGQTLVPEDGKSRQFIFKRVNLMNT